MRSVPASKNCERPPKSWQLASPRNGHDSSHPQGPVGRTQLHNYTEGSSRTPRPDYKGGGLLGSLGLRAWGCHRNKNHTNPFGAAPFMAESYVSTRVGGEGRVQVGGLRDTQRSDHPCLAKLADAAHSKCAALGHPGSSPGTGTECVEAVSGCRWGKPIRKDDRLKPGREVTREGRLKNEASVHAYSTHS